MIKYKILILAMLIFVLAGCRSAAVNNDNVPDSSDGTIIEQNSGDEEGNTGDTSGEGNEQPGDTGEDSGQDDSSEDTGTQIDTGTITNPEYVVGKKMDFEALDKLDNTKRPWGFKPNSEHMPPAASREVQQLMDKYDGIYVGDTSQKVIYLTFDEGYENGYTPKILDVLKENDVQALFFVTGPYINKHEDLVRRMLDEGHQVGNHSINHPSLPSTDNPTLENELYGLEERFNEKFGVGFKYMRPPMGEYSERTLAAAQQLGYKTVFWSFTYLDWDVNNQRGADFAYQSVIGNLHNGAVLLLHAVSKDNAEALDRIIKEIKLQGYEIKAFDL